MGLSLAAPAIGRRSSALIESWPAMWAAAGLSLAVAWVHLAYWESHFDEWWAYGAFFIAVGAGQALFAPVLLAWPSRAVLYLGIAGNLGVIAMYVISRTAGVPLGPHADVAEHVGAVDLAATAAEIALVGLLIGLLGARARRWAANVLMTAGVALWALRVTDNLP